MGQLWAAAVLAVILQGGPGEEAPSGPQPGPEPALTDPAGKPVQGDHAGLDAVHDSIDQMAGQLDAARQRATELERSQLPTENPNKELIQRVREKLRRLNNLLEARRRQRSEQTGQQPSAAPQPIGTAGEGAEEAPAPRVAQPDGEDAAKKGDTAPTGGDSGQAAQPVTSSSAVPAPRSASPAGTAADKEDEPQSVPLLDGPVDPLAAARACLRSGQYQDALRYYRMVDQERLPVDERHWVLYEQAMCWKMVGDYDRAQALYREVASRAADRKLREACQWQLESLQWRRQADNLVRQLEAATKESPGS